MGKDQSLDLVRTQTMERAKGHAVPIEFRTLSMQVTETQRSNKTGDLKTTKGKNKNKDDDVDEPETDFFSTIDFHKLNIPEVSLRFNTNETLGLSQAEAQRRLSSNGPNILDTRKPNYIKKILGYVFGGFCSVLWIGVITFFVCWQPILQPDLNPTNLALAILVVSIFIVVVGEPLMCEN
jgi:sodium/potassium-transporting ATPase subunit alpha